MNTSIAPEQAAADVLDQMEKLFGMSALKPGAWSVCEQLIAQAIRKAVAEERKSCGDALLRDPEALAATARLLGSKV